MPIRLSPTLLLPAVLGAAVAARTSSQTARPPLPLLRRPRRPPLRSPQAAPLPPARPYPPTTLDRKLGADGRPRWARWSWRRRRTDDGSDNQQPPAITWTAPPTWSSQPNPNPMRVATYKVGDGAELTVARAGGTVDMNVQRLDAAVRRHAEGRPHRERQVKRPQGDSGTHRRDTFLGTGMTPSPRRPRSATAGRCSPPSSSPPGLPYFFKLLGPADQVDSRTHRVRRPRRQHPSAAPSPAQRAGRSEGRSSGLRVGPNEVSGGRRAGSQARQESLPQLGPTYCGGLLIVVGLALMLMGVVFTFSIRKPGPYSAIITFVAFPSVIAAGIVRLLGGMWRESRRRRRLKTTEALPFPSVDLNVPRQRHIFMSLLGAASVLLVAFAFAGYNGFLLTESVGFCGSTCHVQMGPEMTAYQKSPHASVPCVACHVGDGAGHYVASKLNGMKQLAGVVFGTYDKPIPTPVKGLRPARETCEECHWPAKTWGSQLYQRPHFGYDEKATPEQITMLMKIGGGQGAFGRGIHWHMSVDNEVTFVSDDDHLQSIPWVRVKRADGSVAEYTRTEKRVDPAVMAALPETHDGLHRLPQPPGAHVRHARRGHRSLPLTPPGVASATLPWVKSLSVDTLSKEYPTRAAALHEV